MFELHFRHEDLLLVEDGIYSNMWSQQSQAKESSNISSEEESKVVGSNHIPEK